MKSHPAHRAMDRLWRALPMVVLILLMLHPAPAVAATIITGTLTGSQMVPAVVTPGSGTITVSNNETFPSTPFLDITADFTGLLGGWTAFGLYGPASPGQNAALILDIAAASGPMKPAPGARSGSFAVMDASLSQGLVDALKQGRVYASLSSSAFPNGEIRAQLVPEPGTFTALLAGCGLLAIARRRIYKH